MANGISEHLKIELEALLAYQVKMQDEPSARSFASTRRLAESQGNCVGFVADDWTKFG
jgi:hypothetical protein